MLHNIVESDAILSQCQMCTSTYLWFINNCKTVYYLPRVLQISIRLTTFSCFSNCNIFISRNAVIGNCNTILYITASCIFILFHENNYFLYNH